MIEQPFGFRDLMSLFNHSIDYDPDTGLCDIEAYERITKLLEESLQEHNKALKKALRSPKKEPGGIA